MIYLIDRGFRINNALNILVNQCKNPGINNECFCLDCNVNDKYNVNVSDLRSNFAKSDNDNDNDKVNDNDNDNDLLSSFTDNDNDNDNENINDNDNDKDNVNDNVNDNVKDNDNDNVNDNVNNNFIYLFDEKHQRDKPNNKE